MKNGFRAARAATACACALALVAGVYGAPAAATSAEMLAWAESRTHLDAGEALTLLRIAQDLFRERGQTEADYARCIDAVDAAAGDPEQRAAIDNAMGLVQGALRRLGHADYGDIADEDERARMARMLTEGRWLRQFRLGMDRCLGGPAGGG